MASRSNKSAEQIVKDMRKNRGKMVTKGTSSMEDTASNLYNKAKKYVKELIKPSQKSEMKKKKKNKKDK